MHWNAPGVLLFARISLVDNLLSALRFEVLYRRPDHETEVEDQHQTYAEQCKVLDHSLSFSRVAIVA